MQSTGMGSGHPRPTTHDHSSEVHIPPSALSLPFPTPLTPFFLSFTLSPTTDGSNPPALTRRPSRTSSACANPPPARTRPSSLRARPRPCPRSHPTSTSRRPTSSPYHAAQPSHPPPSPSRTPSGRPYTRPGARANPKTGAAPAPAGPVPRWPAS